MPAENPREGINPEEPHVERGIDHPSIRAILRFSERFLPANHRAHTGLSHVGESTIVTGYFIGSIGGPHDATMLPLGVVAPDGTPFGLFGPLPLADEPIVAAHSINPESPLHLPVQQGPVGDTPITDITEAESKDIERTGEQLLPYFHRLIEYARRVTDPNSPSHPDRLRENGLNYRSMRHKTRLSREEVSKRMGVDSVQLAAFEGGLIPSDDLPEDFVQRLNSALGNESI